MFSIAGPSDGYVFYLFLQKHVFYYYYFIFLCLLFVLAEAK